ncbi:DUF559 domain-containing protein [Actinomycetes bacterium M1A6_2h]
MGVWTRAQLLVERAGSRGISQRVASGELVRVLPAVYSTPEPSYLDLCKAVTMWKPKAVLSHESAAWLWSLLPDEPSHVHATMPVNTKAPDWVRLHRRSVSTTVYLHTLPVVTKKRCILDLADTMTASEIERVIDQDGVDIRRLERESSKWSGWHGVSAVRTQLRTHCHGTRSEPERMVARAVTVRHLRLEINGCVGKFVCDLVDRWGRVIVEIDGYEFHSARDVFTRDRIRQNWLVLDGWLVLRYSAATVNAHLDDVADEIVKVVRQRRRGRPRP